VTAGIGRIILTQVYSTAVLQVVPVRLAATTDL